MNKEKLRKLLEKHGVQHEHISFAYTYKKKHYCTEHLELDPMNLGAMKQHVRGVKHKLDWDTGKPLYMIEKFTETNKDNKWVEELFFPKKHFKKYSFWEIHDMLKAIISFPDTLASTILVKHGVEGGLKDDIMFYLLWKALSEKDK